MNTQEKEVRKMLKLNAIFSLTSGIVLVIYHVKISIFMTIIYPEIMFYLGIGLIIFATLLAFNAFKPVLSPKQVVFIIWQDWIWVITSFLLIIFTPFNISVEGNLLIGGIAIIVMSFAILQKRTLNKVKN